MGALRLIQVNVDRLRPLLEKFDGQQTLAAVKRFADYAAEKAGQPAAQSPQGDEMLKAAVMLLTDLKRSVTEAKGQVCLRRLTEAEAASEQALALVRRALQGPRIIL